MKTNPLKFSMWCIGTCRSTHLVACLNSQLIFCSDSCLFMYHLLKHSLIVTTEFLWPLWCEGSFCLRSFTITMEMLWQNFSGNFTITFPFSDHTVNFWFRMVQMIWSCMDGNALMTTQDQGRQKSIQQIWDCSFYVLLNERFLDSFYNPGQWMWSYNINYF